jgi:hypothetical protein
MCVCARAHVRVRNYDIAASVLSYVDASDAAVSAAPVGATSLPDADNTARVLALLLPNVTCRLGLGLGEGERDGSAHNPFAARSMLV